MARSNFYRLDYSNSKQLDEWSQAGRLPAQGHELAAQVRLGNYVLAAKFDATLGIGEVRAVGRVSKLGKEVEIDWRSARFDLHPSTQGQRFWLKDYFNFDAGVSARYELARRCSELFPDAFVEKGADTNLAVSAKAGHIYVIKSPHGYKLGKSRQLRDRARLFSVKLPFPIEVVMTGWFDDYSAAELRLHRRFAHKRLEGEWFDLSSSDLVILQTELGCTHKKVR